MRDHPGWDAYHRATAANSQKEVESHWKVFVEWTSPDLRRFASSCLRLSGAQRRGGDIIEADDVLFEAYRRLLVAKYPVTDPRAWLHGVIRYIVFGWTRREPRVTLNLEDHFGDFEHRANAEDVARVSVAPTHEQAHGHHPRRRQLRRALRALPEKQKRVILGLFYCNIPRDELARRLGIKPNSVSQLQSRAIKLLGGLLR